jgi:hypothetical protein
MARALEFERLIDRTASRKRSLALALVVQRLLAADSKLATSRSLEDSTLCDELGLGKVRADDLYAAMDYLPSGNKQSRRAILETNTAAVYRSSTVCCAIATDVQ